MIRVHAAAVLVVAACSGRPAAPAAPTASPLAPAKDSEAAAPASPAAPSPTAAAPSSATAAPANPAAASPPTSAVATAKVTLGDVGLEAGTLDRTADPCVDFYQFACGGWLANNPVPPDQARWGRGAEVVDRNNAAIKSVLETAAKSGSTPVTRKLGDFYASCMDEAGIERAGITAFRPVLAKTDGVKDAASWLVALAELHKLGIPAVWINDVFADEKASTVEVSHLDAAGLGLPDRDYYVKPEHKDQLERYQAHVARMLGLVPGRRTPPTDGAAAVVAIESELAKLTKTAVERRDPAGQYNPTDVKSLARQARSVDWLRYFQLIGEPSVPTSKLIVGTPAFFAGLDKLRARFKPAQWASYFTYHLIVAQPIALPRALDDEEFELEQLLTGVEKQRDRNKRCIELTSNSLGELLGQEYVARYFPASSKQTATQLVDAIASAMADEIGQLDWMSEPTRQTALAKLAKLVHMVGYPDRWRSYDFDVKRDDLAGNALRAAAFEAHRRVARAGAPVDRGEWAMNAYRVDAYYNETANNTGLPAGILEPPFFGQDRSIAANFGGIGAIIGHELTHGFDNRGAQFDADGNIKNWWQKSDLDKFTEKARCVADEYSGFEVLPKKFIQGELTLSENIADMGGAKMAFRAYRALRKDAARLYLADGFTEDQQFFLGLGQAWCAKIRPAEAERRLAVDPHSPPKFRVYGALRNLPEFAEAFHCVAGTPMRPAKACSVW